MRFKINCACLIVGSKFTVFALFYFVFEGNFPSASPGGGVGGAYIWRGYLMEGFLCYQNGGLIFGGLIHGGAYFRNFTVYFLTVNRDFIDATVVVANLIA